MTIFVKQMVKRMGFIGHNGLKNRDLLLLCQDESVKEI